MSDGKRLYSKVFFNSKLTPLVQKYLDNDDKVIIKINLYRLFNKSVVIIDSFAAYWNPRGEVLGNPTELTMTEVNDVLLNPDERYASSPGNLQARVTMRNPGKLKNAGQ